MALEPTVPAEPNAHLWSRDGFVGVNAIGLQPGYTPDYQSVEGLHAPRRVDIMALEPADRDDPDALPTVIMTSRLGVAVSVSGRRVAMPFTLRNVEADEIHFVQAGTIRFDTEFGALEAGPQDFVCIPRSVAYRACPLSDDFRSIIVESPEPLSFDTPAPFGMIDFGRDVRHAEAVPFVPSAADHHILLLKAQDGLTRSSNRSIP